MQKKQADADDGGWNAAPKGFANKQPSKAIGAAVGRPSAKVNNQKDGWYDPGVKKQGYLQSALDDHGYQPSKPE